jgi:tRNA pseudouridine38-40 synthase
MGQVVGFRIDTAVPTDRMALALNANLPPDTRVTAVQEVGQEFHARFSATSRRYVYLILARQAPSALLGRYTWHLPDALDVAGMEAAGERLRGERDFAAWANDLREAKSSIRFMRQCSVRRSGPFIMVWVEANAFLKGMVRNIVGTLVQVGRGKRPPEDFDAITGSRDRGQAGPSAPARGLCLVRVRY